MVNSSEMMRDRLAMRDSALNVGLSGQKKATAIRASLAFLSFCRIRSPMFFSTKRNLSS